MEMRWCNCPNCNHKLFRYNPERGTATIEIKCHSCKGIALVKLGRDAYELRGSVMIPKGGEGR